MNWGNNHHRILSHPIRLHWAGWESDTYTLQRQGWEFAAHERFNYPGVLQLAFRHEKLRIQGLSDSINIDGIRAMQDEMYLRDLLLQCQLASRLRIDYHSNFEIPKVFNPIDCEPSYAEHMGELRDMNIFRSISKNVQKVFLEEPSMAEILNMALKKQAPRQEEIRKQLLKREHLESITRDSELSAELRLIA